MSKDDVIQAISKLSKRAALFQRKLDTYENRKSYSRTNRSFELYRSRFYHSLVADKQVAIEIKKEEVVDFWATMWKRSEEPKSDFSTYLSDCIPSSQLDKDAFTSEEEFVEVIKYLPSWKLSKWMYV